MINIIKIQCPHCGVEGQLMVPESDALIIGPCPECTKTVAIFAGKALALDKDLLAQATKEEAYNHLYEVLEGFIRDKLDKIFNGAAPEDAGDNPEPGENDAKPTPKTQESSPSNISAKEIHTFVREELPLLDNEDYFKTIFG